MVNSVVAQNMNHSIWLTLCMKINTDVGRGFIPRRQYGCLPFPQKPRRGDLFVEIDAVILLKLHRSGLSPEYTGRPYGA